VGKGKGHIPLRTCISCGEKKIKKELIRLALDRNFQVIKNDSGKKQGRGAYVCRRAQCLKQLSNHKRLNKIFKSEKNVTLGPGLG
jgi:predicted RNA-binding protein YlxR (DUF448 family)